MAAEENLPALPFESAEAWEDWLRQHYGRSSGVWLKLAKKASGARSVTYEEALETALCYGWIDGQKRRSNDTFWLQRFVPRRERSVWSKRNREKAAELIAAGRMQPAGLRQVALAKNDGRWEAAYDAQGTASVPEDFRRELDRHPAAAAFFATLSSRNRYAILFRIQTAKRAETRARRIRHFIDMLNERRTLYP